MTRITFNEQGDPIPLEALPDGITEDTDLAPITFQPVDGEIFTPADWIAFGYTHYEISCVGAAGGKAGIAQYFCGYSGWMPGGGGQYLYSFGGGGGGGGLHVVTGELDDLPAECDIVVGESGADGLPSSGWTPSSNAAAVNVGTPGADGGSTSFAETVCMASGGEGGKVSDITRLLLMTGATINNIVIEQVPGGDGGDGGIGGQMSTGGGGSGADPVKTAEGDNTTFPMPDTWQTDEGDDGAWDGEIGAGGGGGSGGTVVQWGAMPNGFVGFDPSDWDTPEDDYYVKYSNQLIYWVHPARNGGKGSFSFSDGSKSGARGVRGVFSPPFGTVPVGAQPIVPGGGGGARPTSLLKYGSDSPGYSPEGFVLIRVFKVV